jgi:hypothetical protein
LLSTPHMSFNKNLLMPISRVEAGRVLERIHL